MRHVRLVVAAFVLALVPSTVMAAFASSPNGPPLAPAGFHAMSGPPPGAIVYSEVIAESPAACAAENRNLAARGLGVDRSCQLVHTWWSVNHEPLPAGSRVVGGSLFAGQVALASVPAGYWYWAWGDQTCSRLFGCNYLNYVLTEDGVANGSSVWQWNHGCTAGGLNSAITWCGFLYNGGGAPYGAMQFGLNSEQCVISRQGTLCQNHFMRRWIDDNGYAQGYQFG